MFTDRVLSGMRPTGSLHLGHYHGVLKNWVELQQEFECLFFVANVVLPQPPLGFATKIARIYTPSPPRLLRPKQN